MRLGIAVARLAGHTFGLDHAGHVWVSADLTGSEPATLWHLLAAHARGWEAIEGSRKRLPGHRLKLCGSCGSPALVPATVKKCRCCRGGSLTEIRLHWAGHDA